MNLTQWGLIFNFVGSFFLSLHIIGRERVEKIDKCLKSLPDAPYKYVEHIIFRFVQFQINKTESEEDKWKNIWEVTIRNLELDKGHASFDSKTDNLRDFRQRLPGFYYFLRFLLISYLIFVPVIVITKVIIGLPLRLVLIFFFIKDRLKIESSLGVTGIILLFIGFFLQFIGSFVNR